MAIETTFHKSVLRREVLEALNIKKGEIYIDATIGGGGHTKGILEFGGKVLGLDLDPDAIRRVANRESLIVNQAAWLPRSSGRTTPAIGRLIGD